MLFLDTFLLWFILKQKYTLSISYMNTPCKLVQTELIKSYDRLSLETLLRIDNVTCDIATRQFVGSS